MQVHIHLLTWASLLAVHLASFAAKSTAVLWGESCEAEVVGVAVKH